MFQPTQNDPCLFSLDLLSEQTVPSCSPQHPPDTYYSLPQQETGGAAPRVTVEKLYDDDNWQFSDLTEALFARLDEMDVLDDLETQIAAECGVSAVIPDVGQEVEVDETRPPKTEKTSDVQCTEAPGVTARLLFDRMQGFGRDDDEDVMLEDVVMNLPGVLAPRHSVANSTGSSTGLSDSDAESLMSAPSPSQNLDDIQSLIQMDDQAGMETGLYEPREASLKKIPELNVLLDEQPTSHHHRLMLRTVDPNDISFLGRDNIADSGWVSASATSDDTDTDEEFIPSPGANSKRSRRKSPKLWTFLLDALCDPTLNPSVISWVNKSRGIFKIEDTKKLPDMWGRRVGKKTKEGTRHNMNYEKFSRAIRYYYRNKVMNSITGRLSYQFGPNAIGWRARAEGCKS